MNTDIMTTTSPSTMNIDIVATFLAARCPSTHDAYRADMEDFTRFLNASDANEAAQRLLGNDQGNANWMVLEYRNFLVAGNYAAATINRRLATLRSLTKVARMIGLIAWQIEVEGVKRESYRDTRGPGKSGFKRILSHSEQRTDPKGLRDLAIIFLLHDLALRRGEVVSLNIEDVNLEDRTVMVKRKGRTQKIRLSLPDRTCEALTAWIDVRGNEPGPLFTNFSQHEAFAGGRLSAISIYRMIQKIGKKTGQRVTPHGLRHTAITTAVERAQREGIDLAKVLHFSGHRELATLQIYVDNYENYQGKIAGMVAR